MFIMQLAPQSVQTVLRTSVMNVLSDIFWMWIIDVLVGRAITEIIIVKHRVDQRRSFVVK